MAFFLPTTSDILRVVTDAAADIEVHESHADLNTSTGAVTPDGNPLASITTATTTTLVAGASSVVRNVRHLSLRNAHASTSCNVTLEHDDGTNTATLIKCNLLAGESLVFDQGGLWTHYDANGSPYVSPGAIAADGDVEAGTSITTVVTPGRQHRHPSALKCWGKANGAGTTLHVSYNTTSISDTGTGRLGVNIDTDFSGAHYSITYGVERSTTSLTATGVEACAIRNASPAAGSFEIESFDHTATTMAAQDPSSYFWQCAGDQ